MLVDGGCQRLEVSVMSEVESRRVLLRHLDCGKDPAPERIGRDCDVIAQRLGHLALALDLAGAYIGNEADQEAALSQYIEDYDNHRDRLLKENAFRGMRPTEKTVWTVWDTTIKKLEEEYPDHQPLILLAFVARFKGASVQDEMFRLASTNIQTIDQRVGVAAHKLPSTLRQFVQSTEGAWDSYFYRQSRDLLVRYSLMQRVEGQWPGIAMHDLVKWRALQYESTWHWEWWYMVFVLATCLPLTAEEHQPDFRRHLIPHLPKAHIESPKILDETQAYIFHVFGIVYSDEARWKEAEELQKQGIETCISVFGQDHPDTLASMANLASTYLRRGGWEEAERLQVQVVETCTIVLGQEHPDTLTNMNNLALTYMRQGRWEEAEQLQIQVAETSKNVLGQDHPGTLTNMSNLASTYWARGREKEAEELEEYILATRKRVLGQDHPDTLISMVNLAFNLKAQGQDIDAIRLLRDGVQRQKRVLGDSHSFFISASTALIDWETASAEPDCEQ